MKSSKNQKKSEFSRREFVWMATVLPFGGAILPGCGGSGGGSAGTGGVGGVIQPIAVVNTSLGLSLPSAFGSDVTILSSGSKLAAGPGSLSARVLGNGPSLLTILESSTGKLLAFGIADPGQSANVLDETNLAASMMFLGYGASNLSDSERRNIWQAILASSSLATFTGVLSGRIAANKYAIFEKDSSLLSALETAITNFASSRGREETAESRLNSSSLLETVPDGDPRFVLRPDPDLNASTTSRLSLADREPATAKKFGFVQLSRPELIETTHYILHPAFNEADTDTVIAGPIVGPASGDAGVASAFANLSVKPISDGVVEQKFNWVVLRSVFDPSKVSIYDQSKLTGFHPVLKAESINLYRRAAVGLAAQAVFELLGQGGYQPTRAAVQKVVENLLALGGSFAAGVQLADTGRTLGATLRAIWGAGVADNVAMQSMLSAMQPLAPTVNIDASAERLNALRATLGDQWRNVYFDLTARFGVVLRAHSTGSQAEIAGDILVRKVSLYFDSNETTPPPAATYKPGDRLEVYLGGAPVLSQFHGTISELRYTLSGAGSGTVEPKPGKTGKVISQVMIEGEGENRKLFSDAKVNFAADCTGVQTLKVELWVQNNENNWIKLKEVKHDFAPAGVSVWGSDGWLAPAGAISSITVTRSKDPFMNQWQGVDPTKLRFTFETTDPGLEIGTLDNNNRFVSNGKSLVSTTNRAVLRSGAGTFAGSTAGVKVTVAVVDPGTGAFTNLTVFTRRLEVDVQDSMALLISSASFGAENFPGGISQVFQRTSTTFNDPGRVSRFSGPSSLIECLIPNSITNTTVVEFDGPTATALTEGGSFFIPSIIPGVADTQFYLYGKLGVTRIQRDTDGRLLSFVLVGALTFANSRNTANFFANVMISFGFAASRSNYEAAP